MSPECHGEMACSLPYKVDAVLSGFGTEVKEGVTVSLGTSTDLTFGLKPAALTEEVTVLGSRAAAI